jgi:hypothetical protein
MTKEIRKGATMRSMKAVRTRRATAAIAAYMAGHGTVLGHAACSLVAGLHRRLVNVRRDWVG